MKTGAVQVGEFALTLRTVLPSDSQAVTALHTLVFGPDVDGAWFTWKYGQATGQGRSLGLWHDDNLIAYCGGLPRTLWQHGKSRSGLQIGDVMVHPAWRGILTRRGPFFQVSQRFYQQQLGVAPERAFQLGVGFPNARHLRLAVLLGLLHDGGVMESLHWPVLAATNAGLPWHWRWKELLPTQPGFDRAVDAAWQAMRLRSPELLLGQRDAAYLRWRFADRPAAVGSNAAATPRYRFYELRRPWSLRASGVAVLDLRADAAHWLDWVGPIDLMPLASTACRLQAAHAGASELTAWASAAVAQCLAHTGITQREVCAALGLPTTSDLAPSEAAGLPWWLMGGDTDFL